MESSTYAIIDETGLVVTRVLWDGNEDNWKPEEGYRAILVTDEASGGVGSTYKDGKFIAPPVSEEETQENMQLKITINVSSKKTLMERATQQIQILQDAVDLEMATDDEARVLPLWKKYRVLLNRIDANVSDEIKWPDLPK